MNINKNTLKRFEGGLAVDDRGHLKFINDFNFGGVKRFYQVENHQIGIIRAFHGHLKEAKYVYVVKGSIILCAVPFINTKNPDKKLLLKGIYFLQKNLQYYIFQPDMRMVSKL